MIIDFSRTPAELLLRSGRAIISGRAAEPSKDDKRTTPWISASPSWTKFAVNSHQYHRLNKHMSTEHKGNSSACTLTLGFQAAAHNTPAQLHRSRPLS